MKHPVRVPPPVEGDHADGVPSDHPTPRFGVVEYEGEDAVEVVEEVRPPLLVEGEDDLAVRVRLERIGRGETRLEIPVVVDLAVHGQDRGSGPIVEGLRPVGDVHDGQSFVDQDRPVIREDAGPVRAPVPLKAGEGQRTIPTQRRVTGDVENA